MDKLLKEKSQDSAVSAPLDSDLPEDSTPVGFTEDEVKNEVSRQNEIENFETRVAIAERKNQKWMEVPKNLLVHICRGNYPKSGYITYKNVKVCEIGKAEELAQSLGQTAFQRAFPGDTSKVGK